MGQKDCGTVAAEPLNRAELRRQFGLFIPQAAQDRAELLMAFKVAAAKRLRINKRHQRIKRRDTANLVAHTVELRVTIEQRIIREREST